MISPRFSAAVLALILVALGGCASRMPADNGQRVRAIMASQVAAPTPPAQGAGHTDGVAAVAAYANYQQSYATPVAQGDRPAFGAK